MTAAIVSLKSDGHRPSSPGRRVFVLLQTKPGLDVLATSSDETLLERERDTLLGMPWDQDADGARELRILPAIYLSAAPHDRRSLQRRNRFR